MRELVYYVAVSLDGYIAGPSGQFDAFVYEGDHIEAITKRFPDALPTHFGEEFGINQLAGRFDSVLMGWNTYAVGGLDSPYRHLEQIVFSRTHDAEAENLRVTDADPSQTVQELKMLPGKDIWLCGGGTLATELRDDIDRLVLKHNPVMFNSGIPLFAAAPYEPQPFQLIDTTHYKSGVVISEYQRQR